MSFIYELNDWWGHVLIEVSSKILLINHYFGITKLMAIGFLSISPLPEPPLGPPKGGGREAI